MTREEVMQVAKIAATETVNELIKRKMIVRDQKIEYKHMSNCLEKFYEGNLPDETLEEILREQESDEYYRVLPLYYGKKKTLQEIAMMYPCDQMTIWNNKKRLVLEIYDLYYNPKEGA